MNKYKEILRLSVLQYFVYRLNFVLWRIRNIFSLIFLYYLWTAVFLAGHSTVFSYSSAELMSYIFIMNVLNAVVLGTRTSDVSAEILNGNLSNYLLRPFAFFKYVLTKEMVDKGINLVSAVFESLVFFWIVHPSFYIPHDPVNYVFMILALSVGLLLAFFISLTLSFVAFWSTEVWAPRFVYITLISLIAGTLFPLDILPNTVYKLLFFTPFPYLLYVPVKLYLGTLSMSPYLSIASGALWAFLSYQIARYIWLKGLKTYSAYGK